MTKDEFLRSVVTEPGEFQSRKKYAPTSAGAYHRELLLTGRDLVRRRLRRGGRRYRHLRQARDRRAAGGRMARNRGRAGGRRGRAGEGGEGRRGGQVAPGVGLAVGDG